MLVDLRWELDKITRRIGAGERRVALGGKKPVQGMTKLMEQRDHVIPGNERGSACGRFLIVADVIDNRPGSLQCRLLHEITHPRPAAFAVTGVEVAVEERHAGAVSINDLPDADVRMVNRQIKPLDEAQAEQLAGGPEYAVNQYGVEGKVGFDLCLIKSEFLPAHLLGIPRPVPGLGPESTLLLIDYPLNICQLLLGTGARRRNDIAHKGQRGGRILCHMVGSFPGGIVRESQQRGLFRADFCQAQHDGAGIVFIAFFRTRPTCFKELFPGLAIA